MAVCASTPHPRIHLDCARAAPPIRYSEPQARWGRRDGARSMPSGASRSRSPSDMIRCRRDACDRARTPRPGTFSNAPYFSPGTWCFPSPSFFLRLARGGCIAAAASGFAAACAASTICADFFARRLRLRGGDRGGELEVLTTKWSIVGATGARANASAVARETSRGGGGSLGTWYSATPAKSSCTRFLASSSLTYRMAEATNASCAALSPASGASPAIIVWCSLEIRFLYLRRRSLGPAAGSARVLDRCP